MAHFGKMGNQQAESRKVAQQSSGWLQEPDS